MASTLIDTLLRVLDARRTKKAPGESPTVHDVILELLYRNDCRIRERVTTTAETQAVHLLGIRGHGERPLWLISSMPGDTRVNEEAPRYDAETHRVVGSGTVSGCADLVVKILAAARIPVHEMKRPVCIAAIEGLESQRDAALDLVGGPETGAGVALVGAATGLELWTGHPGSLTLKLSVERAERHRRMPPMLDYYEVTVDGRGAHHRTPDGSIDAIESASELLSKLREEGAVRLLAIDGGAGADRVAARTRMLLATGTALDTLPDGVRAEPLADGASVPFPIDDLYEAWRRACQGGIRHLTNEVEDLSRDDRVGVRAHVGRVKSRLNRIESLITLPSPLASAPHDWLPRFTAAAQGALGGKDALELQVSLLDDRPALSATSQSSEWLEAVQDTLNELTLPSRGKEGTLTTDAGHLQEAGVPAVVWGAGRAEDMFTPDESVSIAELERALEFYESMIRRWCT